MAAYCRVSTDSDEQMDSLENQQIFFQDYARRNNHQLIHIYADPGISGKQMKNRLQFLKMLDDAKLGVFDIVMVKDVSRFARNTVDFLESIRKLKSIGVEVNFLSNNQTNFGDSEFVLTMFSAMAQEESANLSKRVKFGKKINATKGRVPTRVYGYDRPDNFTLVPNDYEAEIVHEMYQMYVYNGYGAAKISKILNERKVPTKLGGNGWSSKTVRRILANPVYIGHHINNKCEIADFLTGRRKQLPKSQNLHHDRPEFRIIDDNLFQKAQERMDAKRKIYKNEYVHVQGKDSTRHLFSTLIKCEHCGYSYSRRSYRLKNGRRKYWMCTGFNLRGRDFCNNNIYVQEYDLLHCIHQYFRDLIKNKKQFIESTTLRFAKEYQEKVVNVDLSAEKSKITKLNSEKERYKTMYVNGVIGIDELKSRVQEFDNIIAELELKVSGSEMVAKRQEKIVDKTAEIRENIISFINCDTWTNMDLKNIIDKITVKNDGEITVHMKLI